MSATFAEYGVRTSAAGTTGAAVKAIPGMTEIENALEAVAEPLLTVAVKPYEPAVVGVPESVPSGDSATPGGSCPAVTDQTCAPLPPPAAASVALYATSTSAPGVEAELTESGGPPGRIVITNGAFPSPSM